MLAHPILVLPCVCENVEGSHSLAIPWIERNSTSTLVNSAKLGRQGTKILVHILINYTIYDAILVCFSCLPLNINVINCMRNTTQWSYITITRINEHPHSSNGPLSLFGSNPLGQTFWRTHRMRCSWKTLKRCWVSHAINHINIKRKTRETYKDRIVYSIIN